MFSCPVPGLVMGTSILLFSKRTNLIKYLSFYYSYLESRLSVLFLCSISESKSGLSSLSAEITTVFLPLSSLMTFLWRRVLLFKDLSISLCLRSDSASKAVSSSLVRLVTVLLSGYLNSLDRSPTPPLDLPSLKRQASTPLL